MVEEFLGTHGLKKGIIVLLPGYESRKGGLLVLIASGS